MGTSLKPRPPEGTSPTMLVTSSPSTAILLNRSVTDHHRYQVLIHSCSVHLHLLQVQDGAVFQEGWRNSVSTTYPTYLYYFIQPWIKLYALLLSSCYFKFIA